MPLNLRHCATICSKVFSSIFPLASQRRGCRCSSSSTALPDFWHKSVQRHLQQLRTQQQQEQQQKSTDMLSGRRRRLGGVNRLLALADDIQQTADDLRQLQQLMAAAEQDGDDLQLLARQELQQLQQLQHNAQLAFFDQLCETSDESGADGGVADDCDALVEIRSGAGGVEAMLFAAQLANMYRRYAGQRTRNWSVRQLMESCGDQGGVRMCAFNVSGNLVYSRLRHEAGVHRVQRVPRTERSGRVHTSTAAVSVLPLDGDSLQQLELLQIPQADIRVDTMRAGGAGGQHVNTTDSAVRVLHLPTGLVVECQTNRSQHKNREMALQSLRAKLFYRQQLSRQQQQNATRKQQVGSMERSEKIRTYNVPQDRVTDHRLGVSVHGVAAVLHADDKLDAIIQQLVDADKRRRVLAALRQS